MCMYYIRTCVHVCTYMYVCVKCVCVFGMVVVVDVSVHVGVQVVYIGLHSTYLYTCTVYRLRDHIYGHLGAGELLIANSPVSKNPL